MSQVGKPRGARSGAAADFVTVIVPIYNGEDGVTGLLEALRAQDYPHDRLEVLIVDNGSRDRTMDIVQAFAEASPGFPLRLITEHEQRGSYAARNKAVAVARGEILAFTDGDCRPAPGWISSGVETLRRSEVEQVAGAIQFEFANDPPNIWEFVDSVMHLRQEIYVRDNQFGATANLFVRAAALRQVGGFRSDLKSGGDFEFGQRMRNAGFGITYCPDARIGHAARDSHREVATKVRRVGAGLATLVDEGRLRPFSLRDLKPRRRAPDGTPVAALGFGRRTLMMILINYFHYMRLASRLSERVRKPR